MPKVREDKLKALSGMFWWDVVYMFMNKQRIDLLRIRKNRWNITPIFIQELLKLKRLILEFILPSFTGSKRAAGKSIWTHSGFEIVSILMDGF